MGIPTHFWKFRFRSIFYYVWNGHNYALAVVERLELLDAGGMIRVGPVHYYTLEEIERFGEMLKQVAA